MTGCWLWKGHRRAGGRPVVVEGSKRTYAYRIAFAYAHGREPKGLILHSCDNSSCCNPQHLREGTQTENMRDRTIRGRGTAKANARAVRAIREMHRGGVSRSQIGALFQLGHTQVGKILHRQAWRYID